MRTTWSLCGAISCYMRRAIWTTVASANHGGCCVVQVVVICNVLYGQLFIVQTTGLLCGANSGDMQHASRATCFECKPGGSCVGQIEVMCKTLCGQPVSSVYHVVVEWCN